MSYPLPRDPGNEETCSQCGRTHAEVRDGVAPPEPTWRELVVHLWAKLRRREYEPDYTVSEPWIYLQLRRSAGPRLQGNYAVDVPLCSPLCRAMFERVREKLDAAEVAMQDLRMKAADPRLAWQLAQWDAEGDPTVEDHPRYSAEEWNKMYRGEKPETDGAVRGTETQRVVD